MKKNLTYKDAGVDIDAGNKLVSNIKSKVRETFRTEVLSDIGGFGALFGLDKSKYKDPVLVSSTDGVGTKLKIAFEANKHNTIGIDLVAMSVNDVIVQGAEPLFFLDYFATGKLDVGVAEDVISGIVEGCKIAGCSLVGGETAEMPSMYADGEYDLAGFVVGIVDKENLITGKDIKKGDILLGIPSSGLHSNGYSLVRKILDKRSRQLNEILLTPTKIYVKPLLKLFKSVKAAGAAHITGGSFKEKIVRIFPKGLKPEIDRKSFPIPEIFKLLQEKGNVEDDEMFRVFNMGIGMVLVLDPKDVDKAQEILKSCGEETYVIGKVV